MGGAVKAPGGVESLLGSFDGDVHILGGTFNDLGQEFSRRRVDNTGKRKEWVR